MAEPRLPKGTSKNHCENIDIFYLGQEKNFASGQLIFDNWSVGPVDIFFEPQPKFCKSNECQHAKMDANAEVATWRCQVLDVR